MKASIFKALKTSSIYSLSVIAATAALSGAASAEQNSENMTQVQKAAAQMQAKAGQSDKNIVQTAASQQNFSTLVSAVQAAGLSDTLSGEGPYTVFAPTNAAFGKLPDGTVKNLLKPENKAQLSQILSYHVAKGSVSAQDLVKKINENGGSYQIQTLNGAQKFTAKLQDGKPVLTDGQGNTSSVTQTDINAQNGVIHVIDSVIMPNKS